LNSQGVRDCVDGRRYLTSETDWRYNTLILDISMLCLMSAGETTRLNFVEAAARNLRVDRGPLSQSKISRPSPNSEERGGTRLQ